MSVGTPAAMARVIMQSRADCVVACVAMLSGQPSARVWEDVDPADAARRARRWGSLRTTGGVQEEDTDVTVLCGHA